LGSYRAGGDIEALCYLSSGELPDEQPENFTLTLRELSIKRSVSPLCSTKLALLALIAGIDILRGGTFGFVMGYLFAVIGAIRWLFVIPAAPVLAVVVIALCVMVIYGLAKYSDYFEEA
jgi:hypothetical protein